MGISCSRRLRPSWEEVQADLDEAIGSAGHDPRRTRRDGRRAVLLTTEEGATEAEVQLQNALRSGDPALIEMACSEAEAEGLDQAKVSMVRAEVRWIRAKRTLEEALESGEQKAIERATADAEKAGIDASQLVGKRPSSTRAARKRCSFSLAGIGDFISSRVSVAAAVFVLLYEWIAYNFIYLGRILPAVGKDVFIVPFMVFFNIAWGMAAWSFVRCHHSDPGFVPQRWYEFVQRTGDGLPVAMPRLEWQPGKATMCKRCDAPRPERAHHCHVCGACVLRMDHHCPWINNCVGFSNHKFFLLLIGYCFTACLVTLATSCPELIYCAITLMKLQAGEVWQEERIRFWDTVVFLVFGLLALLFASLLAPVVLTHFELASYNMTSIEGHFDGGNMPNPFDQGTTSSNLAELFGAFGFDWFFPVYPAHPLSDGICFVRSDAEDRLCADSLYEAGYDVDWDTAEEQVWRLRYQVRTSSSAPTPRRQRSGSNSWWWGSERSSARSTVPGGVGSGASAAKPPRQPRVLLDRFGRRIVSI